jgi:plasmid stability protein
VRMVNLAAMGRKKLGREPFNLTMPPDIAEATKVQAAAEHRTSSALVEELLRAYLASKAQAKSTRKGAK